jgi:uncharacterized membrane protein
MDLRLAVYEWSSRHRLDVRARSELQRLAGLDAEPPGIARWLPRVLAILAAALLGLALILWIAANWSELGRAGRFTLLQAALVAATAAALWRGAARAPLALLALLAIGALLAYFGQTYQTGADPWQLFALWALLALPLALALRSDVLWAPWALVAMTAVSLWTHAHTAHRWRVEPGDLPAYLMAWSAAIALVAALGPALRRVTGASVWALRAAATLAVIFIAFSALGGLFFREVAPQYAAGLLLLAAAAGVVTQRAAFDVYVLSALALALDGLVVAGLGRWLFDEHHGDGIGRLFLLGLAGAGLLAASVSAVLRVARRRGEAQ